MSRKLAQKLLDFWFADGNHKAFCECHDEDLSYEEYEAWRKMFHDRFSQQVGEMCVGVYVGDDPLFKDKRALLLVHFNGIVWAGFDEGPWWMKHSWITFPAEDWELDKTESVFYRGMPKSAFGGNPDEKQED